MDSSEKPRLPRLVTPFLHRKAASKSALVEYDFDSAWPLKVPGDWNSEREDLLFDEAPVWHERSFVYHKRLDSRVFLYCGAATYAARAHWHSGLS